MRSAPIPLVLLLAVASLPGARSAAGRSIVSASWYRPRAMSAPAKSPAAQRSSTTGSSITSIVSFVHSEGSFLSLGKPPTTSAK